MCVCGDRKDLSKHPSAFKYLLEESSTVDCGSVPPQTPNHIVADAYLCTDPFFFARELNATTAALVRPGSWHANSLLQGIPHIQLIDSLQLLMVCY